MASVQLGQVIEAERRVGMFWPKNLLPDLERFLIERFGFGVLAHSLVQPARLLRLVAVSGCSEPKNLLPDPERFLKERFGFGVLAHRLVQHGQVIEARGRVGMFWPKNLLPDPERFLVERFGFGVLAHSSVQLSPRLFRAGRGSGCSGPRARFASSTALFRNGNRLLIFSLFNQLVHLLIQRVWIIVFGQRCRACENPEAKC